MADEQGTGNGPAGSAGEGTGEPPFEPAASRTQDEADGGSGRKRRLDPTRYGDWEKDGRCIDF